MNPSVLSNREKARYALLFTKAQHKNYRPMENDSLIDIAIEYYAGHKEPGRYGEALMYKGCVLFDMMDYNGAMEHYKQAEEIGRKEENDPLLGLVYTRMAETHRKIYSDDSIIIATYHRAASCFERIDDRRRMGSIYSIIGSCYIFSSQKDSAEYYLKKSVEVFLNIKDDKALIRNYYLLMILYNTMERYWDAKRVGLFAMKYNNAGIQYQLCLAYAGLRQIDLAKSVYAQFSGKGDRLRDYIALTKIYEVSGNYKEALHYNQKGDLIADSIMSVQNKQEVLAVEKRFDYNKVLTQKQKIIYENRIRMYTGLILLLMSLCMIVVLGILNMHKKRKLSEYLSFIEQLRIDKQLAHETLLNRLSKDDVAELQLKEALGRRLRIVDEISDILYQFGGTESAAACNAKLRAVVERNKMDSKLLDDVCVMADRKYNGILTVLEVEYPELGKEELRFLGLICGGFSYTTIALFYNSCSLGKLYTRKHRLGKKMGLDVPLEKYIEKRMRELGVSH